MRDFPAGCITGLLIIEPTCPGVILARRMSLCTGPSCRLSPSSSTLGSPASSTSWRSCWPHAKRHDVSSGYSLPSGSHSRSLEYTVAEHIKERGVVRDPGAPHSTHTPQHCPCSPLRSCMSFADASSGSPRHQQQQQGPVSS